MLSLIIPKREFFNDKNQEFIDMPEQSICLEHSLISVSRWESRWKKPYLSNAQKTTKEVLDYIRCMSVNKELSMETLLSLSSDQLQIIQKYIDDPMTATTFSKNNTPPSHKIMTTEVIYSQMIALNIPFACEKWHLHRLFALIKVCSIENQPQKKMSKKETMSRNQQLNQARRAQYNTRG